jgi:hypothetical protein
VPKRPLRGAFPQIEYAINRKTSEETSHSTDASGEVAVEAGDRCPGIAG